MMSSFRHRQLHGHVSYKQAGRHSVSNTVKSSNRILELCTEQKPDNFSHSASREAEYFGKSRLKYFQAFHRMDAQSKHFQGSGSQTWSTRHGPICIESEPPDTGVRIMAIRAKCDGNRCIQSGMKLPSELPISSIQPDFLVHQRDTERSGRMHSHCTRLEKSRPWYPILLSVLSHQPLLLPQSRFIVQLPGMNKIHTFSTQKSFRLSAWKISGKDYKVKDFLTRCPTFSSPHGEKALQGSMRVLGDCGVGWCDSWHINCFSISVKNIPT